jgi:hypothetical protein
MGNTTSGFTSSSTADDILKTPHIVEKDGKKVEESNKPPYD